MHTNYYSSLVFTALYMFEGNDTVLSKILCFTLIISSLFSSS